MNYSSVLTQYLNGVLKIPPPATLQEDVCIGPNIKERQDHKKNWQRDTSSFKKAVGSFLGSGCVYINNVLPKSFVQSTLEKVSSDYIFLKNE